ncbi:hypothetical protein AQUCO_01200206v1 [Aquilegia coerulea]|uniref:Gnk2-homologous domain-containing protein n=1 Tax=Aquilegia coerulea TaxID=218851 RepID=A0A2G5E4W4_AQUCA|nr:hypothetical protein AQUCO_01200206v1 [Aquilegia coerulea]
MSSGNLVPLSMLFFFTLLLKSAIGVEPLYHICSSSFNYSSGSPFDKNLNTLFNQLSTKVPPTGFGQSSVGGSQETAHGLALCRGDVSTADCKSCVSTATAEIKNRCTNDKAAVIWYDACLLRYSNVNFLGSIDSENKFYLYNTQNVSDIESFNGITREFLSRLTDKAYRTQKLFATDEMNLDNKIDKLYGLVQCTRDLSGLQCKRCLDNAISEFPNCCDSRRGGRVITGSCNFRYELYPFVITKK